MNTIAMKQRIITLAALTAAFGAGAAATHFFSYQAAAASPALRTQVIDLATLSPGDLPPPEPGPNAQLRTRAYVDEPGAVVRVQIGTVPKHYHVASNEIQYVVAGTGTEWLGSKRVPLRPGLMLIIPKGVVHGGLTETRGRLKMIVVKTPPQSPSDNHRVP
jgi:mannose-6-phosphate isomerase-like protein (cupin superfamily)